jgi:protein-tyrosine-phosphatase
MPAKSKTLFLCTRNACRSQMTAGWARHPRDEIKQSMRGLPAIIGQARKE